MEITILMPDDMDKGFLESLESLRPTGLTPDQARSVYYTLFNKTRPYIFVAKEDDKVVGTATLVVEQKFIHQGGRVGHIEDVSVHKDHKGKGIGQALTKRLIETAEKCGCYKVILDCSPDLVPFYEKSGFYTSAVQMRLDVQKKEVEPQTFVI